MTRSLVWRLVAKDLYLYRWLIGGAAAAGLLSLLIGGLNRTDLNLGMVLFITTIVAYGIFLAMFGVMKERQEKSLLFVLSLPISTREYTAAKIAASMIAFLIPWLTLLVAIVVLTDTFDNSSVGRIPLSISMMGFFLSNFCVLLAIAMVAVNERWAIAGILVTNMSISLYIGFVANLPGIKEHLDGPVAVWTPTVFTILVIEAVISVLSIGLALLIQSRKRDFV